MSKLAKGLVVGTLAAGFAVLAGTGQVSASAAYGDWKAPEWGQMKSWGGYDKGHDKGYDKNYDKGYKHGKDKNNDYYGGQSSFRFNDVNFNENYDKSKSVFYYVKSDEKKSDNESYKHNSYNQNDGKGWGKGYGGYTNAVSIDYQRDNNSYKSYEESKKLKEREQYAANYNQSNVNYDFGKGRGHGGNLAASNVSASVAFKKEYDYAASVKAVAAHNSSVGSSVSVANTGPYGGQSSNVSAYENTNSYSRVEASVAEKVKQEAAVNYSANNLNVNQGGKWGGGNLSASSTDYNAYSNYEASREVKYVAEESNSSSSGFNANNASYNGGGGYGGGNKY